MAMADEHEIDRATLPDGRELIVREGRVDDAHDLHALYQRLSDDDRFLRFFSAAVPSPAFFEKWLTIGERGGLVLVVFTVERNGRTTLVGEAGYSLLDDGDGELGITVDPLWRGWVGGWLLGVLLREAATHGVPNLQAVVQTTNRPMLGLLRHHGTAIVDQPEPSEIRLAISTTGHTPGWPVSHDKPRILVEAAYGHWAGEKAARDAGFDVRTCRGPGANGHCPMVEGDGCPLVEGADVVVSQFPDDAAYRTAIVDELQRHPDLHLVLPAFGSAGPDPDEPPAAVIEQISRLLGVA